MDCRKRANPCRQPLGRIYRAFSPCDLRITLPTSSEPLLLKRQTHTPHFSHSLIPIFMYVLPQNSTLLLTNNYRPARMKLNISLLLVTAVPGTVLARVVPRGDEAANDTPAAKQLANVFAAQKCWTQSPYGCSKNRWCWQRCQGNGQWCWLAHKGGTGDWTSCTTAEDCIPGVGDSDCAKGDCKACGCSC